MGGSLTKYSHAQYEWTPSLDALRESERMYSNVHSLCEGAKAEWPLMLEIERGHYRNVVCLLARGANVRISSFLDNRSSLDWAVDSGCALIVYELLKLGMKPTLKHILIACREKNASMLGILM